MEISSYIFDYIKDNTRIKITSLCKEFLNYLYSKGSIKINEIIIPSDECFRVVLDILAMDKVSTKKINIVNSLSIIDYGYLKNRYEDAYFDCNKFIRDMEEFMKIEKYIFENKEEL